MWPTVWGPYLYKKQSLELHIINTIHLHPIWMYPLNYDKWGRSLIALGPNTFNEIKHYHFSSISFQAAVVKKPKQEEKQSVNGFYKVWRISII